jgi:hypothetical protein
MTGQLQPLDRDIFGKLKHQVKCMWKSSCDKFEFFEMFQQAFAGFSPQTIQNAFVSCINVINNDDINEYHHENVNAASRAAIMAIDNVLLDLRQNVRR